MNVQARGAAPRTYSPRCLGWLCTLLMAMSISPEARGVTIALNGVIGPPGTDANAVKGLGNPVNQTGVAANGGSTTLTFAGSPSPSSFDFNTGFGDAQDRTIGSNPGIGANHVYADRHFNSATTDPMQLDTNNNISFGDEVDSDPGDPNTFHFGFGMHSDGFITYDLSVIRTNNGLAANEPFILTGQAGVANRIDSGRLTSGAIILDSTELAVYDWNGTPTVGVYDQIDAFTLSIPGSARYLTFAGLSGLDGTNSADHIGFRNVELSTLPVPEPTAWAMLGPGGALLAVALRRRGAKR